MTPTTRSDLIDAFQRAMRDLTDGDSTSIVNTDYDGQPASAVVVITGKKATADVLRAVHRVMDRWDRRRSRGQV